VTTDREADVVAEDRGGGGHDDQRHDRELPVVRQQRGPDQRGLPGHRDAHGLDRDQREDRGVADVRRDVDDGREQAAAGYVSRPGIATPDS
jgi:hypothetical protein